MGAVIIESPNLWGENVFWKEPNSRPAPKDTHPGALSREAGQNAGIWPVEPASLHLHLRRIRMSAGTKIRCPSALRHWSHGKHHTWRPPSARSTHIQVQFNVNLTPVLKEPGSRAVDSGTSLSMISVILGQSRQAPGKALDCQSLSKEALLGHFWVWCDPHDPF